MIRLGAVVSLLFAVLAAQAGAALRAGDFTLRVRAKAHGRVCLLLAGPGGARRSSQCERPPRSAFEPLQVNSEEPPAIALGVPRRVDHVTAAGRRFDAVRAGRIRLVLAPGVASDAIVRMYDASGALIGAAQDPFVGFDDNGGTPVFRTRYLTIRVQRGRILAPTPLKFDRVVPQICTFVQSRHGSSGSCGPKIARPRHDLGVAMACAPARGVLHGFVSGATRQVELRLGSGRRLRVGTRPVPERLVPGRLVATVLPRGEAVRSARGLGAGGRVLWSQRIGAPPTGGRCGHSGGSEGSTITFGERPRPAPGGTPVASGGGRRLRVADGASADVVCAGIEPSELQCLGAPVDASESLLTRDGQVVFGVLSQDVASLELRLTTGRTKHVRTIAGRRYRGRLAGHIRFALTALPAGVLIRRAIARDAGGHSLGRVFVAGESTSTAVPVVPGLDLHVDRYTTEGGRSGRSVCLRPKPPLGFAGDFGVCASRFPFPMVAANVSCTPRRTIVYGTLPRGATGVRVGRFRPVVQRFPKLGRAWVITLPADIGARTVRFLGHLRPTRFEGKPPARWRLHLPPASRQCGYDFGA